MENDNPYLSIVVISRNDNHGGSLLRRMQIFINALIAQCDRYKLKAELIIIEWNPPEDKLGLTHALNYPQSLNCPIRIIEVPPHIHHRFKYAEVLPLFQMIGKNIGIRKAKGEYVLATNIDILFSDRLMEFLASKKLKSDSFYRVDRYDVDENIPLEASIQEQLAFCDSHCLRSYKRDGVYNFVNKQYQRTYSPLQRLPMSFRHFIWNNLKRYDLFPKLAKHLWAYRDRAQLHTNACGDFTLMSKRSWETLRGYPELEIYSLHIDSLFCFMAYYSGLKEVILSTSMPVYHIDHSSGWTPESNDSLDARLSSVKLPKIQESELDDYAFQMHSNKAPIIFNQLNWGLVDDNLVETFPNRN